LEKVVAYIPKSAKWYLAEIVQQITVESDPRNVVHTNLVLAALTRRKRPTRKRWNWGPRETSLMRIQMESASVFASEDYAT
jgi:hypothetical protein